MVVHRSDPIFKFSFIPIFDLEFTEIPQNSIQNFI